MVLFEFTLNTAIWTTVLGLAYIISPIDLIPDVIPVIGWTDDMLVFILILFTWAMVLVFNPMFWVVIALIAAFLFRKQIQGFFDYKLKRIV